MTQQQIFALHYLFTVKGDRTVAHCLDLDLVVTAKNEKIAEDRLNTLVKTEFALAFRHATSANALVRFTPAPPHFWAQLRHAKPLPPATLEIETPPMVVSVEQAVVAEMPVLRAEVEPVAA